jgi:hypothetical protein
VQLSQCWFIGQAAARGIGQLLRGNCSIVGEISLYYNPTLSWEVAIFNETVGTLLKAQIIYRNLGIQSFSDMPTDGAMCQSLIYF